MTTGIYPDLKDFEKIVSQINISDTWRSVPFGGSYTIVGEEKTYLCFLGKGTPDEGFYILDGIWKKISAPIETKMFAISKNGSDTISLNAKKSLVVAIGCIAQVKEPQKDFIITVNNEGILSIIGKKK